MLQEHYRIAWWDMNDAMLRKELGARVKALRKDKNWSQKELAARWTSDSSNSTNTRAA